MTQDKTTTKCGAAIVACFSVLVFAPATSQQKFYRCESDEGTTIFSDVPCSDELEAETTREAYKTDTPANRSINVEENIDFRNDSSRLSEGPVNTNSNSDSVTEDSEQYALFCESANGLKWYRHDSCPEFITEESPRRSIGVIPTTGEVVVGIRPKAATNVPVTQSKVPLDKACREIYKLGKQRPGSERDHEFSTYDRNLGRDPCRQ